MWQFLQRHIGNEPSQCCTKRRPEYPARFSFCNGTITTQTRLASSRLSLSFMPLKQGGAPHSLLLIGPLGMWWGEKRGRKEGKGEEWQDLYKSRSLTMWGRFKDLNSFPWKLYRVCVCAGGNYEISKAWMFMDNWSMCAELASVASSSFIAWDGAAHYWDWLCLSPELHVRNIPRFLDTVVVGIDPWQSTAHNPSFSLCGCWS